MYRYLEIVLHSTLKGRSLGRHLDRFSAVAVMQATGGAFKQAVGRLYNAKSAENKKQEMTDWKLADKDDFHSEKGGAVMQGAGQLYHVNFAEINQQKITDWELAAKEDFDGKKGGAVMHAAGQLPGLLFCRIKSRHARIENPCAHGM